MSQEVGKVLCNFVWLLSLIAKGMQGIFKLF
jgi:hypothetical protein